MPRVIDSATQNVQNEIKMGRVTSQSIIIINSARQVGEYDENVKIDYIQG